MKKWMRTLASVVMAGSMLATMLPFGAMAEAADTTVTLGEAQVLKHGRTYEKDGTLYLDWTNSGISFNFEGTGAKAVLTASSLTPNPGYVNVYVDGALTSSATLYLDKTKAEYTLAENLPAGSHTITLRKRNEAVYGSSATVGVASLTITGGSLKAAPAAKERRIEVIGDSITCGFGNLAANTNVGYSSHVSDGTSTYATMAAQALNAEIDVVARSGIRFVRVDESNSIFPVYDKVSGLENKCNDPYDFENNEKDVVVINLGTNDNGAREDTNGDGQFNSPEDKLVTDAYIQSEAKAFLEMIRMKNPNAEIVWAYGIMGSGRVNAIKAAIKEVNDAGDNKVSFYALDQIKGLSEGYGTGSHPTVATSINRSFGLAEYIAEKTGWSDYRFDVQLAQQKRLNAAYDREELKQYTEESAKKLADAMDAVDTLSSSSSNADIKNAVAALYSARAGLVVDMEDVAMIGAEEKTGTGHYMSVTYTPSPAIDVSAYVGRKLYITYDIMVETTNAPTTKAWLSFVKNGQAGVWTDGTTDDKTRINVGSPIGFGSEPMDKADTEWVTVTAEVPAALAEGGEITAFKLYVYNDTAGMNGTDGKDPEGITWSNDTGVSIKVKNVKLMSITSDYVNKEALENALKTQKSAGQLTSYTDESVAAYNKLFTDAKAVFDNTEATQQQVNEAVASLKGADKVLVLKDENTVAIFWSEEKTSNEDHYLSLDAALETPLDLTPYANDVLMLSYDIRINTTESHPGPNVSGWLDCIRNGEVRLFSVDAAQANNDTRVTVGGDDTGKTHCKKNELANIQANEWMTVTVPVPQKILEDGRITKFHMFLYNDLNACNAEWANNVGVTLSLRNVKIVKEGSSETVNKDALNELIAEMEDVDPDIFTIGVEEFKAALAEAKRVAADPNATQADVDKAAADLETAYDNLDWDIDFDWGNIDGKDDVTAADALMALQAATQKITLDEDQEFLADVNGDGEVAADDALLILQYSTKKINSFPVEAMFE